MPDGSAVGRRAGRGGGIGSIDLALLLLLGGLWGTAFLFIPVGLRSFSPILFVAIRFDIVGLVLFVLAFVHRAGSLVPRGRREWTAIVVAAAFNVAGYHALLFWGQQFTTAGVAAIIVGLNPVLTTVFSRALLADERGGAGGDRLSRHSEARHPPRPAGRRGARRRGGDRLLVARVRPCPANGPRDGCVRVHRVALARWRRTPSRRVTPLRGGRAGHVRRLRDRVDGVSLDRFLGRRLCDLLHPPLPDRAHPTESCEPDCGGGRRGGRGLVPSRGPRGPRPRCLRAGGRRIHARYTPEASCCEAPAGP